MKLRFLYTTMAAIVVAAAGVLVPSQASAATVSLYHVDGLHVNRVLGHGSAANLDTVYEDSFFSTHNAGQQSYATISNADLLTALTAALGPSGGGYQINSATFFAGTTADNFADASVGAYVTTSYDPTTLTYNNQPQTGGTPTTTALSFGSVSGSTTTWDVSGGVDAVSDTFLFWETGSGTQFTVIANGDVHLEVDAIAIPEPSAFVMLSIVGLMGLVVRRRRRG